MSDLESPPNTDQPPEEAPPLLSSWKRVYAAVLFYLFALILLFRLFGEGFTP